MLFAVAVGTTEATPLVNVAIAELTLAGKVPVKLAKAPVVAACLLAWTIDGSCPRLCSKWAEATSMAARAIVAADKVLK